MKIIRQLDQFPQVYSTSQSDAKRISQALKEVGYAVKVASFNGYYTISYRGVEGDLLVSKVKALGYNVISEHVRPTWAEVMVSA